MSTWGGNKPRWGDADDDGDDNDFDQNVLPDVQVIGPDKHGIKIIIEHKVKEDGQRVKTTRKVRERQTKRTVTSGMVRRRNLAPFGAVLTATEQDNSSRTAVSTEEILLEKVNLNAKKDEQSNPDAMAMMASTNATLLVCRICGKKGDHWTSKCPYKDLAASKGISGIGEKPPGEDDVGGSILGPTKPGGYVPPTRRGEGESMRPRRDDSNSIRVSNLSEDTQEADLQDLFRPFGPVTRIYVAYNRETNESRGFAFVNFVNRDDAERAIKKLDGYGYDNLILRCEWAAPREDRPQRPN